MPFINHRPLPCVYHIEDSMGVCFTLILGKARALLLDAGYGFEDVAAHVRSLTDLPVTLWLSHAHHDHAMGARWFDEVRLCPGEVAVYGEYASEKWTGHVLREAREAGVHVDEAAWRARRMPAPTALDGETLDLGGVTARVIPCPGHTPGSAVVFVHEYRLLLTGDDWNPCTWLFFPEALGIRAHREHLRALLELPFESVLCPHRTQLYPRSMLEDFVRGLTDAAIDAAKPTETGVPFGIATREVALPHEQVLVFDPGKA